jgi:hypothetical protein
MWVLESINTRPDFTLDAWRVFEVPFNGPGKPWTRHFTGFRREGCKGQVSSPVEFFDPVSCRGVTRSGRLYHLAGRPGMNGDAFAVWGRFKYVNRIAEEREVTDLVVAIIERSE